MQTNGEGLSPPRFRYHVTSCLHCYRPLLLALLCLAIVACTHIGHTVGLTRVRDAGVLRVATDPSFPPFESVDAEGQIVGFDVDLAHEIAEHLEVQVQFVTTGYDALYDALTVNRADVIISALYPDPDHSTAFVFSTPYFDAGEVLVVPLQGGITDVSDLAGKSVACTFGTRGHMAALQWQQALTPPPDVITADSPAAVIDLLSEGTVDAIVLDRVSALVAFSQNPMFVVLEPPVTSEPYAIAARKVDATLIKAIDEILADLEGGGALASLESKWMHSQELIKR